MLNEKLVQAAIEIVISYLEAENIYEETKTIRKRAIDWYNHTEIVDPQMLAAVVISGEYKSISWDEVIEIENFYFPLILPLEFTELSIGEIEESLHDEFWR